MKNKKCPICELQIPNPIPTFCEQCGWDFSNDITLIGSIGSIPERVKKDYQNRIDLALKYWNEKQEVARLKKELENENIRIEKEKIEIKRQRNKTQLEIERIEETKKKQVRLEKENKGISNRSRKKNKSYNIVNCFLNKDKFWNRNEREFTRPGILLICEIIPF